MPYVWNANDMSWESCDLSSSTGTNKDILLISGIGTW